MKKLLPQVPFIIGAILLLAAAIAAIVPQGFVVAAQAGRRGLRGSGGRTIENRNCRRQR